MSSAQSLPTDSKQSYWNDIAWAGIIPLSSSLPQVITVSDNYSPKQYNSPNLLEVQTTSHTAISVKPKLIHNSFLFFKMDSPYNNMAGAASSFYGSCNAWDLPTAPEAATCLPCSTRKGSCKCRPPKQQGSSPWGLRSRRQWCPGGLACHRQQYTSLFSYS